MRAIVTRAYFDRSGLHRPGEVVDVDIKKMSNLVSPSEVTEEVTETTEEEKPKKRKKKG
jgi:hypothetical protein